MNTGMLWFDNDPKADLPAKIKKAADFYQKKYGVQPDLCFVPPSMLLDGEIRRYGIEVKANQRVMPNHFWLGKQEAALVSHAS
jgi:hypothetical protein